MVDITIVNGLMMAYRPTYHWWAPSCRGYLHSFLFKSPFNHWRSCQLVPSACGTPPALGVGGRRDVGVGVDRSSSTTTDQISHEKIVICPNYPGNVTICVWIMDDNGIQSIYDIYVTKLLEWPFGYLTQPWKWPIYR